MPTVTKKEQVTLSISDKINLSQEKLWETKKEMESIIKNLPMKQSTGPDAFAGEFHETCKEILSILLKLF